MAQRRYAAARSKAHLSKDEIESLDQLVTPLIKKGQSLAHIYAGHQDEIPVCQRTLYRYIDSRLLSVVNLDLRRKVMYRSRKKVPTQAEECFHQDWRNNRSYDDFLAYMAKHPNTLYVEMDTVRGVKEKGKRMLTMLFVECNLMLILLMKDGKAVSVVEIFDWLTSALGVDTFYKLFPVILTDNGSEFKRVGELEFAENGERRTRIFFCDPQASWQKVHIEKNHEYIRYVLPKGHSFSPYSQEDMVLLMNHINSTKRKSLNGYAPYELATSAELQKLMHVLGLHLVPADEVNLTMRLLKQPNNFV